MDDALRRPDPLARTILAELRRGGEADGGHALVGVAHTVLDDHPAWGALLDNLHDPARLLSAQP